MVLCHGMTSRVALVMAPLLPRICTGVGNMGLENGGGVQGGASRPFIFYFVELIIIWQFQCFRYFQALTLSNLIYLTQGITYLLLLRISFPCFVIRRYIPEYGNICYLLSSMKSSCSIKVQIRFWEKQITFIILKPSRPYGGSKRSSDSSCCKI